eukprot:483912_1
MGNKNNAPRKTKHRHITFEHCGCQCKLYHQYNHCCNTNCFYHKSTQTTTVLQALKVHNAECLLNIIMDYVPNDTIQNMSTTQYKIWQSAVIFGLYANNVSPCKMFVKFMTKCEMHEIKVIILGNGGIGKSSLVFRFIISDYIEYFDPNIQDSFVKYLNLNNEKIMLNILDTAYGESEYYQDEQCQIEWIKDAKCCVLCFAMNDKQSFDSIDKYYNKVLSLKGNDNDWSMILVGLKCDLNNEMRCVLFDDILKKIKNWNLPYIEVSAKDNINIDYLFRVAFYEYWLQSQMKQIISH